MVKKLMSAILTATIALSLASCVKAPAPSTTAGGQTGGGSSSAGKDYHIGIVTGTISQSEDEQRGAEALVKKYGAVENGGMIKHVNYPDNFDKELEATIQAIASLANDPKMKAVIVNQAVPGTVAAFQQIRAKRPDILLLANSSQEDIKSIEGAADLVVDPDNVNRGYLMIWTAKELGAKKFVHITFPRHMAIELLSLRRQIMEEAAKDLGIEFINEIAPDPMSDVGIAGAKKYIQDQMPAWVEKYGKDTAFFCTNDAQTEPLLNRVAELGAIFVEPDIPSPIMGYPAALNIDLSAEAGNWPAILKKVEEAVNKTPGKGRMGTWAYSYAFTGSEGLGEFAMGVIEGKYSKDSKDDLLKAFLAVTPGSEWNGALYVDHKTGETSKNHVMVYQDTYVFGRGYMGAVKVQIPEKFLKMKFGN